MYSIYTWLSLQSLAAEIERKAKEEEERTRRRMRETRRQAEEASRRAAGTPEPVPGRAHADIQTETFLEVSIFAFAIK